MDLRLVNSNRTDMMALIRPNLMDISEFSPFLNLPYVTLILTSNCN